MKYSRINAVVHGRVQGVSFRYYTREKGAQLGLSGWVKNRPDGTVETEFEGELELVSHMVRWLEQGSPAAWVQKVDSKVIEPVTNENGFIITY